MSAHLIQRDLQYIWHPCAQMHDYERFLPLPVISAEGAYIKLADGTRIIDAISSWWCKTLGHGHLRLKQALIQQLDKFEHVLLANTTNETIVALSEQLAKLTRQCAKVFYASDGACAVEIALKLSLHSRQITGETQRKRFMALQNSYHGETGFAMSVSDLGLYRAPYRALLFDTLFLKNIPYVNNRDDPLWHDCSSIWPTILQQLEPHAATLTAIIIEPLVQGAGGMLIYSADFLKRLRAWTQQHNIHLIADEIMTGLGRTGTALACEQAAIEPDLICLGKGLTAGFLPLSAVLITDAIYDLFYADYRMGKSFLHSHTFAGNALAAAVALECLNVLTDENIYGRARALESILYMLMTTIAEQTGKLINIRSCGAIVAADLVPHPHEPRLGYQVYQHAVKLGALLRPLGNTIYWCPPLTITLETLHKLQAITQAAIMSAYKTCN